MSTGKADSGSPNWVFIGIGALALLTVLIGFTLWPAERGGPGPFGSAPVACTMEAKLCPDGSSVGRTGPDCEFAVCPGTQTPSGWNTFRDDFRGISFRYPAQLGTTYISATDWPPAVAITSAPFSCIEAGSEGARAGITERRFVDSREYCVTRVTEGAAGSIYTQYTYASPRRAGAATFTFTTRATQCANYDEPHKSACTAERQSFDMDGVVDRMAQSLSLE
ncbi:hypothetical protein K8Q93_01275 [Candidatus Parcubacteria bacterium]|nr:hypothetical protein [Candidatus Parcubacteria bacterium]